MLSSLERIDWEQVGWSAMIGAATGMLSMGLGAVTASITQKLNAAIKLATQMLTYGVIGGLAGATNAWMMNGWQWDWGQISLGFQLGAAFAILLFVGYKIVGSAMGSIKNKVNAVQPERVQTRLHGNNLNTTKPAQGYRLVDKTTRQIKKFGETTMGAKRYTQKWLREMNLDIEFIAHGTKREMYNWQIEMIRQYKLQNGRMPDLNINGRNSQNGRLPGLNIFNRVA